MRSQAGMFPWSVPADLQQSITVQGTCETEQTESSEGVKPWNQRAWAISAHGNTPELAIKCPELSFSSAGKSLLTLKVDLTLNLALL